MKEKTEIPLSFNFILKAFHKFPLTDPPFAIKASSQFAEQKKKTLKEEAYIIAIYILS